MAITRHIPAKADRATLSHFGSDAMLRRVISAQSSTLAKARIDASIAQIDALLRKPAR